MSENKNKEIDFIQFRKRAWALTLYPIFTIESIKNFMRKVFLMNVELFGKSDEEIAAINFLSIDVRISMSEVQVF
jgi:hypothetical protein